MNDPEWPENSALEDGAFREGPGSGKPEMDLARVHGTILREHNEPVEGAESVPLWLVGIIMALVFWAGIYLSEYGGDFRADVFDPTRGSRAAGTPESFDPETLGRRVYVRNCVICHQATGLGAGQQFPPLAGSEWVLAREGRGDNHLVAIVLHGLQGPVQVKGQTYNGAMAPWRFLRDEEIAAALSYIRREWGNDAPAIPVEFVTRVREQTKDRKRPWTQAELLALPREMVGETF